MELFYLSISLTLGLTCAGVLVLLWMILRCLRDLTEELAGLRSGIQGMGRLGEALGGIGDDLQAGRQGARSILLGLKSLVGPWLSRAGATHED